MHCESVVFWLDFQVSHSFSRKLEDVRKQANDKNKGSRKKRRKTVEKSRKTISTANLLPDQTVLTTFIIVWVQFAKNAVYGGRNSEK